MRSIFLLLISFLSLKNVYCQTQALKLNTSYGSKNTELRDIMQFEGLEYFHLTFSGKDLANKSYCLYVKEIWAGKVTTDTIVFDSRHFDESMHTVNDSILLMRVIGKATDGQLKMMFRIGNRSYTRLYRAIDSDEYSLRNIVQESRLPINYDEKFYLFAYILPYKRSDGSKSWCDVGSSGKEIDLWGQKFGIPHYLTFEMEFVSLQE
ncbi:hypothetical protein PQ465_14640 [Sphingobacterium oryzagri]|uniref:Uncharacterized protein n=1 Tax=Sphingobacterium oryzagri TaxID=3025669 RepID=A0ABY7WD00_9SPHI|nr:hypothetical protein [Sphingobacterium sp. KACC 22765]WDF67534.1 hypothetical protein PQ465_14640 [Sphingobacterium sp. KACC 22765]